MKVIIIILILCLLSGCSALAGLAAMKTAKSFLGSESKSGVEVNTDLNVGDRVNKGKGNDLNLEDNNGEIVGGDKSLHNNAGDVIYNSGINFWHLLIAFIIGWNLMSPNGIYRRLIRRKRMKKDEINE